MSISTKNRTEEPEIMDNFALEGEELRDALDKIAAINQLLGGNKLTLSSLKFMLPADKTAAITIIDIGCGNGDMLRKIADFGLQNKYTFQLIGIDANAFTINYAQKLSSKYPNIKYLCEDVFKINAEKLKADIIICTLTLHHFNDDQILQLLSLFYQSVHLGIVINDLQRSIISYRLFQLLCVLFGLNKMSREDGLVSILRGFKRQDLVAFSRKLNFKNYKLHWKWAFRYQWLIQKI